MAPVSGLFLAFFMTGAWYKVLPALVVACYVYLIFIGIRPKHYVPTILVFCTLAVVGVALLGHFKDFTAYDESGPGPFEWINFFKGISIMATLLLVGVVAWRLYLARRVA